MRDDNTKDCDICGCEHDAASTTDSGSLHLCNDCTWTELHVVRRRFESLQRVGHR